MTLVEDGVVTDRFSTYVQPPGEGDFHPYNTSLHGMRLINASRMSGDSR